MPEYKNPGKIEFDGVIIEGLGGGAFVEFPHDATALFGVKGRVPIKASFDGVPYRGSLVKMGSECHCVGILKQIREKLEKGVGDKVHVLIELDVEERKIDLADDVLKALKKNEKATNEWEKLSYTHQREYHLWIEGAKRSDTRANRILQMMEKLASGEKMP